MTSSEFAEKRTKRDVEDSLLIDDDDDDDADRNKRLPRLGVRAALPRLGLRSVDKRLPRLGRQRRVLGLRGQRCLTTLGRQRRLRCLDRQVCLTPWSGRLRRSDLHRHHRPRGLQGRCVYMDKYV